MSLADLLNPHHLPVIKATRFVRHRRQSILSIFSLISAICTARQIVARGDPKYVVFPCKDVPFGGLIDTRALRLSRYVVRGGNVGGQNATPHTP